jgi:hypothetical protein
LIPTLGLVFLIVIALVGYQILFPTFSFNVRLTIEVNDHGRTKSASSVIEESVIAYPSFGDLFGSGYEVHVRGEAVFLDLGEGNNLFALLGSGLMSPDDITTLTEKAFFSEFRARDYGSFEYGRRIVAENLNKPRTLGAENMPLLVHFRDLSNRRTIERVDPSNASMMLGPGIQFLRATLEITNAPVTSGNMERQLPWLHGLIGDRPAEHIPIYYTRIPELEQDSIFFLGFVRR